MNRISNRDCAPYVTRREEFKGSNLFGEWDTSPEHFESEPEGSMPYVVYSYGYHFPIYVWTNGLWYEIISDKYSASTSKHITQARPAADTIKVDRETITAILLRVTERRCEVDCKPWLPYLFMDWMNNRERGGVIPALLSERNSNGQWQSNKANQWWWWSGS